MTERPDPAPRQDGDPRSGGGSSSNCPMPDTAPPADECPNCGVVFAEVLCVQCLAAHTKGRNYTTQEPSSYTIKPGSVDGKAIPLTIPAHTKAIEAAEHIVDHFFAPPEMYQPVDHTNRRKLEKLMCILRAALQKGEGSHD